MDHDAYLDAIRSESEALLAAAAVDVSRPVPTCPDWTVADLLWHIGRIHHRWGRIAAEGVTDAAAAGALETPERPADDELVHWARTQADRLLEVLIDLDPDAPRWNWTGAPQTAAFIPRRMAHETAVHRVDAERAAGEASPVDAKLAADGIDEVLSVLVPARGDYDGPAGFLGIGETDTSRAWAVHLDPPQVGLVSPARVPRRAQPIEQLVGRASEVLLILWGRDAPKGAGELARALARHLSGD
ncbi:MAG: maleylpyruvate isomerase family mycothiol-dependent enzyme [Actinobacteria bacterium]|nr:maleylpyruvate isomerase family mycothiol-dependent enzyme [Actinomycetota bacterium]